MLPVATPLKTATADMQKREAFHNNCIHLGVISRLNATSVKCYRCCILSQNFPNTVKIYNTLRHFLSSSEKLAQNSPAQGTGTSVNRPRQCWCLLSVVTLVRGRCRGAECTSDRADGRHTTELLSS